MKKLLRILILCTICLVLLLGTNSFSISTSKNEEAPKKLFFFRQTLPGIADVSLLGYQMTWDLTPFLSFRQELASFAAQLPGKIIGSACSFFASVFGAFA